MDKKIRKLIEQRQRFEPEQRVQIAEHIATVPFIDQLLEVDEILWGSFWHFDVISPGYRLPVVELALLRATRLDHNWAEGTNVTQFQDDLRETILSIRAGIWTLTLASLPCIVFAADNHQPWTTVVWYCASTGRLHAGYRTTSVSLRFDNAIEQQTPQFSGQVDATADHNLDWLDSAILSLNTELNCPIARLDAEILRLRQKLDHK